MARGPAYEVAGRTVLITGAARGIGAAAAERLHRKGANVCLVDIDSDQLQRVGDRLGERAAVAVADVTDSGQLERAVEVAVERFGGVDVAIANAGIHNHGTLAGAPLEEIERTLEVNLTGVLRTARAVLPQIVERRGYLLHIASLAAASHAPLMGPYAASKAGVEALTDSLRIELAPTGARVGCAYFGFIDTDMVRDGFDHPSSQAMRGAMPAIIRRAAPVTVAADAIERAIARRSHRVWAPRYVGAALLLRGLLQPLAERRLARSADLPEALRQADSAAGEPPRPHARA